MINWSFSALKSFKNCPRRYNEVSRLKRVKEAPFDATSKGLVVHKHLEDAVTLGTPVPAPFTHYQSIIDTLVAIPGEKAAERQFTFTAEMTPVSWFSKDAWLRYAADLLITNDDKALAHLIDYKSGKSKYADTEQLKLGALCVFYTYPHIDRVKGALVFTSESKMIPATYTRDNIARYWEPFMGTYNQIMRCVEVDQWTPKPSGLCASCPVTSCENHKG